MNIIKKLVKTKNEMIKCVKIQHIVIGILSIVIIIKIPFLLEDIVLNEDTWPFNSKVYFEKETWFNFIGTYMGTIAAIFLGVVSLIINHRYKKLSDESNKRSDLMIKEIKEIAWKNSLPKIILTTEDFIYENCVIKSSRLEPVYGSKNKINFQVTSTKLGEYADRNSLLKIFDLKFNLRNISNLPTQFIKMEKISITYGFKTNTKETYDFKKIEYKVIDEFLQGFVIDNNDIAVTLSCYENEKEVEEYNVSLEHLEIDFTLSIDDVLSNTHNRYFHLCSNGKKIENNKIIFKMELLHTSIKKIK